MEINYDKIGNIVVVRPNNCHVTSEKSIDFLFFIKNHISNNMDYMIINLHKINRIDTTGIGCLVFCYKRFSQRMGFAVSNVGPRPQRLFEITRMTGLFDFFPDEQKALKSLLGHDPASVPENVAHGPNPQSGP